MNIWQILLIYSAMLIGFLALFAWVGRVRRRIDRVHRDEPFQMPTEVRFRHVDKGIPHPTTMVYFDGERYSAGQYPEEE